ncbi:MAG: hypothetical protein ABI002_14930 [Saprospiraceae bacterium]
MESSNLDSRDKGNKLIVYVLLGLAILGVVGGLTYILNGSHDSTGNNFYFQRANDFISEKQYYSAFQEMNSLLAKDPNIIDKTAAKSLMRRIELLIEKRDSIVEKTDDSLATQTKQKIKNAIKGMRKKNDEIEGLTYYYDNAAPKSNNTNYIQLYLVVSGLANPTLRVKINYSGYSWLFLERCIFKANNGPRTLFLNRSQIYRDSDSGKYWEWCDLQVENDFMGIIDEITGASKPKVRCSGNQYYHDRSISEKEISGLVKVLNAYEVMGGTIRSKGIQ